MELKYCYEVEVIDGVYSSNRTFMELKFAYPNTSNKNIARF